MLVNIPGNIIDDTWGTALPPSLGGTNSTIPAAFNSIFPIPNQANSWLYYVQQIEIEADSGVVIGSTLPNSPLDTDGQFQAWDVMGPLPNGIQNDSPFEPLAAVLQDAYSQQESNNGGAEVFTQQRAAPIIILYLVGEALRIGYPIPIPSLVTVNGVTPVCCNRLDMGEGFKQRVAAQTTAPIFYASWRIRYVLTNTPPDAAVPTPPNFGLI